MPELPEVESVKNSLSIKNKTLHRLVIKLPLALKRARLSQAKITELERRGKYLLFHLEDKKQKKQTLLLHLGMSGRLIFYDNYQPQKHDHVLFHLSANKNKDVLVFNDPRRFGFIDCVPYEGHRQHPRLRFLGPEPLDKSFTPEVLAECLRHRKSTIKTALLNQKILVGLGNIYVCEILFAAAIHPSRQAGSLSPKEITTLHCKTQKILRRAIKAGGTTLKDDGYRNAHAQAGKFQRQLQVYDRQGEVCLKSCGGQIEREIHHARSTFYCPQCQKKL